MPLTKVLSFIVLAVALSGCVGVNSNLKMVDIDPTLSPQQVTVAKMVRDSAIENHVDPLVALAVAKIETNFNCSRVGSRGERGPMQVLPRTARGVGYRGSNRGLSVCKTGIKYAMRVLHQCQKLAKNDLERTVVCYNAGPGRIHSTHLPRVTRHYIKRMHQLNTHYLSVITDGAKIQLASVVNQDKGE